MKLRLRSALRNLLHKDEIENDLDAEVRAFVNMVADEKMAAGAPQAEAQRRALAECGGIEAEQGGVGAAGSGDCARGGSARRRRGPPGGRRGGGRFRVRG